MHTTSTMYICTGISSPVTGETAFAFDDTGVPFCVGILLTGVLFCAAGLTFADVSDGSLVPDCNGVLFSLSFPLFLATIT